MVRVAASVFGLGALCLLLGGCVYYPYGYDPYGYGYQPPRYRYAPPPPAYGYSPPPASPYGPYPAQPYGPSGYPQTLGPHGDTPGSTGSN